MKLITINPNNEPYYSKEFIKGFKCGAQRQFEADKADSSQEWISCSERLPSKHGDYLTAYENTWKKESSAMVDIDEWKGEWIDSLDGVKGWKIVAWMPLPERSR